MMFKKYVCLTAIKLLAIVGLAIASSVHAQTNVSDLGFHNEPNSMLVPNGAAGLQWRFSYSNPASSNNDIGWALENFDDSSWGVSPGGFYRYNFAGAAWHLEPVSGSQEYVRIASHWFPGQYLHTENKGQAPYNDSANSDFYRSPQVGEIQSNWHSAMWEREELSDGRVRFRNRWGSADYLHVENGRLEVGPISEGWESAKWTIEPTTFPVSGVQPAYLNSYWGSYVNAKSGNANKLDNLDYSIGGHFRENILRDELTQPWPSSNTDLWLRGEFTLLPGQEDQLMFWARWFQSMVIYVNGVEAVDLESFAMGYRHLGLSNAARAALHSDGTPNTIAIKVTGNDHAYFDLGLTLNSQLATLPESGYAYSNELKETISDVVREYMQEQGITAGVLALLKNDKLVLTKGYGYLDKDFTQPMPADGVMRLASNDKVITKDLIEYLIEQGTTTLVGPLSYSTKVFPLLCAYNLTNLQGCGSSKVADDITVDHLINHVGWVRELPSLQNNYVSGGAKDSFFSGLNVSPQSATLHDNVRWIYNQPLFNGKNPGDSANISNGERAYSSAGYMILRYLAHVLVSSNNQDLEAYLQSVIFSQSGDSSVYIARENFAARQLNEAWYNDDRESYSRWMELDNYTALVTSAPAFVKFSDHFGGSLSFAGSMAGSWTWTGRTKANANSVRNVHYAIMFNTGGVFDSINSRIRLALNNMPASAFDLKPTNGTQYRLQNNWATDWYLNTQGGQIAASGIQDSWDTGKWTFEAVDGSYYRIKNVGNSNEVLHVENGSLEAGSASANWWSAQWELVPVDASNGIYQIKNRWNGEFINVEGGTLNVDDIDSGWWSGHWRLNIL